MGTELTHLGASNLARACHVWLNLAGFAWDFDDLQAALALRLGWTDRPGLSLAVFLDETGAVIDAAAWHDVRRHAVEVFFELEDVPCSECGDLDPRSFDEVRDDTQFDAAGSCRLCALDPGGDPGLHRDIAGALVVGRVSWDEVRAAAAA